ncbi:hypothetical protein D3C72_1557170 [compost metagenome]
MVVLGKVLRFARNAPLLQVAGCRHHNRFPVQQGAGHDVGIKVFTRNHEGHVKLVHAARSVGIQAHVQHHLGVAGVPDGHHGRQKIGGQHRCRDDADRAAQVARAGRSGRFGIINLMQDGPHALQIGIPRVSQRQLAGSALQQPRAQMLLQLGHHAGDHRG